MRGLHTTCIAAGGFSELVRGTTLRTFLTASSTVFTRLGLRLDVAFMCFSNTFLDRIRLGLELFIHVHKRLHLCLVLFTILIHLLHHDLDLVLLLFYALFKASD